MVLLRRHPNLPFRKAGPLAAVVLTLLFGGEVAADQPVCSVSPDSLDFGTVTVGSTQDLSFTIKNVGGGTLNGTVSETCADYSLIAGGGVFSIPGGDSLVVTVRFAPSDSGVSQCSIETGTSRCADVFCTGT